MNLVRKLFNSMLVLSLCAIGAIEATPKFKRIIQTIEVIPYTGVNPLSVLDTNHQKVIDLGLYTPAHRAGRR